ncbi:hypothetical protein [Rhodopirellula halodulae]|uniref:hypothetical protein n=1 Tax=Rhodopirellula halodulae TaxID=2894198 RepID=UPI001E30EC90|nr:hypothetical protein [Rhodopirellula sp. JC737]MCC9654242.1 hypothetical protein [Rhodopirellula sp. JC737]
MITHHVRIGFAGDVFAARSSRAIQRGRRVLVRTPRGVELAEILSTCDDTPPTSLEVLRPTTPNDDLLIERLQRHKVRAVRECQSILSESESTAVLLDVDQLFDGGTLVLHFLGEPDALGRELTDAIVRRYEAEVKSIELSDLMQTGCGPGCGTAEASGCGGGCSSCSGCGIASARQKQSLR